MYTLAQNGAEVHFANPIYTSLQGKLANLHWQGRELHSACPHCGGGHRNPDRFFSTPQTDYQVWSCRQCGYHTTTNELLGNPRPVAAPRPIVLSWQADQDEELDIPGIRRVYAHLIDYTATHLLHHPAAQAHLQAQRGLAPEVVQQLAQDRQLGYLSLASYQHWWQGLSSSEQQLAHAGGLPSAPDGYAAGFLRMFAGGYSGKIVFPYYADGQVIDIRTRSISAADTVNGQLIRYISPKGNAQQRGAVAPFGEQWLGNSPRVVITEGEYKALIPHAYGLDTPVLGLRGTHDWQAEYMGLLRQRLVILAFDNDRSAAPDKQGLTPGQRATIQLGRQLRINGLAVMVLEPALLADQKGIDDYIITYGVARFAALLTPAHLVTVPEFEAHMTAAGADLSTFTLPRADVGTVRQWRPPEQIDTVATPESEVVSLAQAESIIRSAVRTHFQDWRPGQPPLLATASAGTGKTTITLEEARAAVAATGQTIAVLLPSHATIEEKVAEGTLAGFQHIYGRRWDEQVQNCRFPDRANALLAKGYSPGQLLCPSCPFLHWCEHEGYKAQFQGHHHRAYVHAHFFSDYPAGEDLVVVDEFHHGLFVDSLTIWPGDLSKALQAPGVKTGARQLLAACLDLMHTPGLAGDVYEGYELYQLLARHDPDLNRVETWGDGAAVQLALDDLARTALTHETSALYELDHLPHQFGQRLFAVMAEDMRRLRSGLPPTRRLRLVCPPAGAWRLELTTAQSSPPAWTQQRPTVYLNATADAQVLQDLMGELTVVAPVVDIQTGNTIIQDVTRNNAKTSFLGQSERAEAARQRLFGDIRRYLTELEIDEADTVIVTTKQLVTALTAAFPRAAITYYGGLEGRNEFQDRSTLILANPPPVNVDAVLREAQALYLGIDTTLTRSSVAFAGENETGEYLAVEQLDAVDARVSRLLEQHRDAKVIQAVQRLRLVRQTGKTIIVLFARPIPGIHPTQLVTARPDRPLSPTAPAQRQAAAVEKLTTAAQALAHDQGGATLPDLAASAGVSKKTAHKYFQQVAETAGLLALSRVPVRRPGLQASQRLDTINLLIPAAWLEAQSPDQDPCVTEAYIPNLITLGNALTLLLPPDWRVDVATWQEQLGVPLPPTLDLSTDGADVNELLEAPPVDVMPVAGEEAAAFVSSLAWAEYETQLATFLGAPVPTDRLPYVLWLARFLGVVLWCRWLSARQWRVYLGHRDLRVCLPLQVARLSPAVPGGGTADERGPPARARRLAPCRTALRAGAVQSIADLNRIDALAL
jgi:hypothetical protein